MFDVREYLKNHVVPTAIEKTAIQAETYFHTLEKATGRKLSDLEKRNLSWLAAGCHETVAVFDNIFKELAIKR